MRARIGALRVRCAGRGVVFAESVVKGVKGVRGSVATVGRGE